MGEAANVRRVLVVDDDLEFGDFVRDVVEELGCMVEVLTASARFKAVFDEFRPDVIVLDISMPDIDGIALINWLAEKECRARIIVASGLDRLYAEMAQEIGMSRGLSPPKILQKPFRPDELRSLIV